MKSLRGALLRSLAAWLMLGSLPVFAQTDNRFAIGADYTVKASDHVSKEDTARGQRTWTAAEIGLWDVSRHWGINLNMIARPDVIVTSSVGTDRRTARADQFILKGGVVYSLFRNNSRRAVVISADHKAF